MDWEKISTTGMTNRGLISKYMNSSDSSIKSKSPIKKMGRKPKQLFLQRRHLDGQQARKDAQHWHLLEKCKSRILYAHICMISESLLSRKAGTLCMKAQPLLTHLVTASPYTVQCFVCISVSFLPFLK